MRQVLLISLVSLAQPCLWAQPAYDFSAVDEILEDSVEALGLLNAGYSLTLLREGEIIYDKSFGRNYSSEEVVAIASATKWLSGSLIMSLVEEGALSLEDTVGKYLPQFTGEIAAAPLRQLFSHTAGMPNQSDYNGNLDLTFAEAVDSIAAYVPPEISPGTGFLYGGVSMHIAGRMAEIATGEDWEEMFKERIATPLEMPGTDYQGLGATENYRIAGGGQSSGKEYLNFLQMLLQEGNFKGAQILSPATVETMLTDQTAGLPIVATPYAEFDYLDPALPETRYGIGNWLESVDTLTGISVENSSQGAFGFSPWIDRKRNLAGVLSVRSVLPRVMPIYFHLKKRIHEAIDKADALLPISPKQIPPPHTLNLTHTGSSLQIYFELDASSPISLSIANLKGQQIANLVEGKKEKGTHVITWDFWDITPGIYQVVFRKASGSRTQKFIPLL